MHPSPKRFRVKMIAVYSGREGEVKMVRNWRIARQGPGALHVMVVILVVFGVAAVGAAQGVPRVVQHLIEVAQDLFPEVESQRVVPSPGPGEPAAVLTARLRPEVAFRRVRQASERARTFSGGAVAGEVEARDAGVRLAVRGVSGQEIGTLSVTGVGREVRIEVWPSDSAGGVPPVESLPAMPLAPEPVMRVFPLKE